MIFIPSSRSAQTLLLILSAAALLPALYGAKHPSPPNPDNFATIADGFARTGTLEDHGRPTAEREPVYPALLGLAYKLFGHSYATELALNGVLAAGGVWLLFLTARRLFGKGVALLSAALAAFYPPFIYYASQPQREVLLVFMSGASLLSLAAAVQDGGNKRYASAGIVNALAALSNTTFLPFGLGTAPVILLWLGRKKTGKTFKSVVLYGVVFLCLYSLWPIRNYRKFHTFILGSTAAAGTVFYVNQLVPAEVGGLPAETALLSKDPTYLEGSLIRNPAEHEKFFARAGLEHLKEDPWRYLKLVAWRFFWEEWRVTPRPRNYEHSYRLLWWVSALTDGWIIPLGLLGLLFWHNKPPEAVLVPAFIASIDFVYALIFFILRYRVPVMPWLILLAALTLTRLWKLLTSDQ